MGRRSAKAGSADQPPVHTVDLSASIARLLKGGDVHAGRRLRPVRALAALFGVDKTKVCEALDELVGKGILIKRHGSGTFVRAVPRPPARGELSAPVAGLVPSDILAPPVPGHSRRRPPSQNRRLVFQLWTSRSESFPVLDAIAGGIRDVLDPGGHMLRKRRALDASGRLLDPAALAAMLSKSPADGYLVYGSEMESFAPQFEATGKPWIGFGFSGPLRHHPCMILDCLEAVGRGVQALLEGGCRRVALLAWHGAARKDMLFEEFQYSTALSEAGIHDYHEVRYATMEHGDVHKVLGELLDAPVPPDGLYIGDDTLLAPAAAEFARRGIVPGRDLALVTHWNEGFQPVGRVDWSRMETSPRRFGQSLGRSLLAATQSAVTALASYRILAEWRPGSTHFAPGRTAEKPDSQAVRPARASRSSGPNSLADT